MKTTAKELYQLMLTHQKDFGEPATAAYLARQLGVTQSALDRHFKSLEREGLIVKQPPPLRVGWRAVQPEGNNE